MLEDQDKNNSASIQTLKNELASIDWPKEGNVVEATLIKKAPRAVYFDLGRFGTGIVYGAELSNAKEILKNLKAGDKISVKIANLSGEDGNAELSLTEAGKHKAWQEIKELMENGAVIKVKIISANAGGLTAAIGKVDLKAFLPVSQLSLDHYPRVADGDRQKIAEELKKFVGEEMNIKIIDLNPRNNKIIISEREVLSENIKELLSKYSVGQVVDGLVSGMADFGVFVRFIDNPEIEGMVHISELDHRLIDNPKEVVKVNDQVKVKIVDIKDGKVFLSLKALKANPWEKVNELYKANEEVSGNVYKLNPFGAVITLDNNLQGLIHVSEFGGPDEMKAALQVGGSYKFIIDSIKPEEKRITLKLKK